MNFHHDILYIQERPISHLLLIPFILFIFSAVLDDSHHWIQLTEPYIMPVQILMCQVLVCTEKLNTCWWAFKYQVQDIWDRNRSGTEE